MDSSDIFIKNSLAIHEKDSPKTKLINFSSGNSFTATYLGNIFCYSNELKVRMSKNKVDKIKYRIDRTISYYNFNSKKNEIKHRRELINRMRFLTGNFRLFNNKDNIFAGIYFNNPFLTDFSDLTRLDKYFLHKIKKIKPSNKKINPQNVICKINQLRFYEGYTEKKYFKTTWVKIKKIKEIWKNK